MGKQNRRSLELRLRSLERVLIEKLEVQDLLDDDVTLFRALDRLVDKFEALEKRVSLLEGAR